MNTQYIIMLEKLKEISLLCPFPGAIILISSNYPCLEHLLIVPKVFELLRFNCISHQMTL